MCKVVFNKIISLFKNLKKIRINFLGKRRYNRYKYFLINKIVNHDIEMDYFNDLNETLIYNDDDKSIKTQDNLINSDSISMNSVNTSMNSVNTSITTLAQSSLDVSLSSLDSMEKGLENKDINIV
tara:strand:- start:4998 stop:5372 length:375 start_codon:yes stop_codon:yes gene_type:complete